MENKINIAEILKDCPKGMKLDCLMYEDVYFDFVDELNIIHCYIQYETHKTSLTFNQHGTLNSNIKSKCVIFPKGKTTWEGFISPCKFKEGDIVVSTLGSIAIVNIIYPYTGECATYCGLFGNDVNKGIMITPTRFATEEEKAKLFHAIKANGYKWNAETKTLEKLTAPSTPEKFYIRIGDIPSEEKSSVWKGDVVVGYEDGVSVYDCVETDGLYRIVMPFPLKEEQGMTYECLIQEITQCRYKIEKPRKVYLVSGIEVGKGHDNEPLIKDVKILKDLTEQFNTKNDNTEENKTLEKLVESNEDVDDKIVMSGIYFDREHYADEVELHLGNYEIEIRDNKTYAVFKNQKNKTLKKSQKFKDGDVLFVQSAYSWILIYKESENDEDLYKYVAIQDHTYHTYMVYDSNPLCYKGDISKIRLATEEEKAKLFQAIKDNGYHWNTETKTLEKLPKAKFDITTLVPFESRVLVRDSIDGIEEFEGECETVWRPAVWGVHVKDNAYPFGVVGGCYFRYCIPYESNEHLLGTTDDCDEFYKTW